MQPPQQEKSKSHLLECFASQNMDFEGLGHCVSKNPNYKETVKDTKWWPIESEGKPDYHPQLHFAVNINSHGGLAKILVKRKCPTVT